MNDVHALLVDFAGVLMHRVDLTLAARDEELPMLLREMEGVRMVDRSEFVEAPKQSV